MSDTHGRHRNVRVPPGDILIHAGDFTHFGKDKDVRDFNNWLGELEFKHKIVINGNHEHNAPWKRDVRKLLSNATFLCDESCVIEIPLKGDRTEATASGISGPTADTDDKRTLKIHGTNFYWPMTTPNPYYGAIADDVDILLCHGPVKGYVDGGTGCETLLKHVERVKPLLVVSGHVHGAHGVAEGMGRTKGTTFVNAANAKDGYRMGWDAVTVNL